MPDHTGNNCNGTVFIDGIQYVITESASDPKPRPSYYFGVNDTCEGATESNGWQCPEDDCDAGDTFDVSIDLAPGQDGDAYATWVTDDGCFWERSGVSTCLIGTDSNGDPGGQCAFTYTATGDKVGQPATDAPPTDIETIDVSSMFTPTQTDKATTAPTVTTLSDGTTITTTQTTTTTQGGGTATVTRANGGGGWTLSIVKNSNSAVTETTTATNSANGSNTTETTTSNSWHNGDSHGVSVSPGGGVTTTTTPGASGGSSTTTTTTNNPDGSSSSNTTTSGAGGGGGAGGAGGGGSPNCTAGGNCSAPGGGDGEGGDSGGGGEGDGEGEGGEGESYGGSGAPNLDEVPTISESINNLVDGIMGSQLVAPLSNLGSGIPTGGTCPTADFTLPLFEKSFTIDAHCALGEQAKPTLFAIFSAIWVIVGIRILFSA